MPERNEPNMELRALVAVVLSMLVLAVYQYWFVPPPEPTPSAVAGEEAAGVGAVPGGEGVAPGPAAPERAVPEAQGEGEAPPAGEAVAADAEQRVVLEAGRYRAVVTNRGARLEQFELVGYRDEGGAPLDLVGPAGRPLSLWAREEAAAAAPNEALWRVELPADSSTVRVPEDGSARVVLHWSDGRAWDLRKEIVFGPDYILRVRLGGVAPVPLYLLLGPGLEAPDGHQSRYLTRGGVALRDGELQRWKAGDLAAPQEVAGPLQWLGVESEYFLAAFLPGKTGGSGFVGSAATGVDEEGREERAAWGAWQVPVGAEVEVFLGPKRYDELVGLDRGLARAVDFGFWGFLARPLLLLLNWIHRYVGNYGVAIILLTFLLRIVFWPLNQKAMLSMRKMQRLQPQMAAIRAKYQGAKDLEKRQRMQEEIMELYRREGVSPFGGCLPMLAQFPLLLAFYAMLSVAIELRGAPFVLWVQDLSRHDPYLVLPLLMGASMIVQQRMTPTTGANDTQARMMRMMPVVFTALFLWVPSGLVLYWLTNNLLGIGQQLLVNRRLANEQAEQRPRRKGGRKKQRGKR